MENTIISIYMYLNVCEREGDGERGIKGGREGEEGKEGGRGRKEGRERKLGKREGLREGERESFTCGADPDSLV